MSQMEETDKDALYLVVYSMIYMPEDLYSSNLFSENFCEGFRAKFDENSHSDIRVALRNAMDKPDFPYEEILPMLSEKYSRQDIYYYLSQFYDRLRNC